MDENKLQQTMLVISLINLTNYLHGYMSEKEILALAFRVPKTYAEGSENK